MRPGDRGNTTDMVNSGNSPGRKRFVPALLAAAGFALAIPGAGLAVGSAQHAATPVGDFGFLPFTPAKVDPALARQVERMIGAEGLRFTPASNLSNRKDRTVTVAVRVDEATARAMSLRTSAGSLGGDQTRAVELALAPTRYNLGIARGYQSFAQPGKPAAAALPAGLRDVTMPDLAELRPDRSGKPSRFQTRVALEQEDKTGRAPRTLEGDGDQSVDVAGSYRVGRNLNVTAGVRLSQERDRLAPLTNGVEDSQSVYVGTQIRF